MRETIAIAGALLLMSCTSRGDQGLLEELRGESQRTGLALVEALGDEIAVIPFDVAARYFRTDQGSIVFGTSGRLIVRTYYHGPLVPPDLAVETVGGDRVEYTRQTVTQFKPLALSETAGRVAFWGRMNRNGAAGLNWAAFDFSTTGTVGDADGPCDWSPDGSTLAYQKQGWIFLFDVATGTSKHLIQGYEPTWSPDGQLIAYRTEESNGALITKDGAPVKSSLDTIRPIHSMRWSPDGRYVLFPEAISNRIPLVGSYYRLVILRVKDGASFNVRQFGAGAGNTGNFHWIVDYRKFCLRCSPGRPFE